MKYQYYPEGCGSDTPQSEYPITTRRVVLDPAITDPKEQRMAMLHTKNSIMKTFKNMGYEITVSSKKGSKKEITIRAHAP